MPLDLNVPLIKRGEHFLHLQSNLVKSKSRGPTLNIRVIRGSTHQSFQSTGRRSFPSLFFHVCYLSPVCRCTSFILCWRVRVCVFSKCVFSRYLFVLFLCMKYWIKELNELKRINIICFVFCYEDIHVDSHHILSRVGLSTFFMVDK